MPITTATTASKKAGAPAPHANLVTNVDTEFNLGDHEMASSDLSDLSDGEVPDVEMSTEEVDKPFPLNPREEDIPSNIVCSDLIDCTILNYCLFSGAALVAMEGKYFAALIVLGLSVWTSVLLFPLAQGS